MNIAKAHWDSDGDKMNLSMPIAKVDTERRIVSGFATLDNVDKQGDIVPNDASLRAFEKFRGNLREMHNNIAVGKVLSFKEDSYYDEDSGKFYNGVVVSAYISKGAQDTWEKVLDGTLTGFSIGGSVKKTENSFDEKLDKSVRIIKDYELHELSLVDNPANQFANVISIQKGTVSGMLASALIENVYYCASDDLIQLSSSSTSDCPRCDKAMNAIGFVESNDPDKAEVVKGMLTKVKKEVNTMENIEKSEAAVLDAPAETAELVEAVEEAVAPVAEGTEEVVEEPVEVEEEATEEEAPAEEAADESAKVIEEVTNAVSAMNEQFASLVSSLADTVNALNEKVAGLNKAVAGVAKEVEAVRGDYEKFGKRVDAVEHDTAFRKSADLGYIFQEEPEQEIKKSLWDGAFLTKSDLFN